MIRWEMPSGHSFGLICGLTIGPPMRFCYFIRSNWSRNRLIGRLLGGSRTRLLSRLDPRSESYPESRPRMGDRFHVRVQPGPAGAGVRANASRGGPRVLDVANTARSIAKTVDASRAAEAWRRVAP
jgi:hypothetical protein